MSENFPEEFFGRKIPGCPGGKKVGKSIIPLLFFCPEKIIFYCFLFPAVI